MRVWLPLSFAVILILSAAGEISAQKKLVVLGSSTAAGNGSSSYANSWVGRVFNYYNRNIPDGMDTTVTNLAVSGYTSYLEMPDNFVPPPGRPLPDPNANVTKALSYNPDVIIINLPSNDVTFGYTKKEFMDNLRLMYTTITTYGSGTTKCYITTTQPRTLSLDLRDSLRTLVDSIKNNFSVYAIDFWSDLVTTDGTYDILPAVGAGDGIHINDLGHNYVSQRVINKDIFSALILPLKLTDFRARIKTHTVLLEWKTEEEEPSTSFDIQRSRDGRRFEILYSLPGKGTPTPASYNWTDNQPLVGNNFYRLRMNENGQITYSRVLNIINKPREIAIDKLYKDNSATNLVALIHVQKSQQLVVSVIDMSGAIIYKQTQYIIAPSKTILVPIFRLAAGKYFLRISDPYENAAVMGFIK